MKEIFTNYTTKETATVTVIKGKYNVEIAGENKQYIKYGNVLKHLTDNGFDTCLKKIIR